MKKKSVLLPKMMIKREGASPSELLILSSRSAVMCTNVTYHLITC